MSAPMGLAEPGDAELVAGVLAGDRDSFAAIYDRYADRLHDFCYSMLRDRQDAADATQDVFLLVAQRLAQLRDPQRLRPWLYAIARTEALRRIRARSRFSSDAEVADVADPASGPVQAAEQAELARLVADAATGLSDRDRALLDLHLRQGLEGAELGEAVGTSAGHAHVLLHRLREQVERSLGALLVARLGRRECSELDTLLSGWDGRFSPLIRKRVARHVDRCEVCGARRRSVASPWALLATLPLVPAPVYLRDQVLGQVRLVAHTRDDLGGDSGSGAGPAPPGGTDRWTRSPRATVLTAAALVVVAVTGGVLVWQTGTSPTDPLADGLPGPVVSGPAIPDPAQPGTTGPTAPNRTEQGAADEIASPDEAGATPSGDTGDPPAVAPPRATEPTAATPIRPTAPDPRLTVSTRRVELAPPERSGSVTLTNPGDAAVRWSASVSESWLVVEPRGGELAGGASVPLTLWATVRDGQAALTVAWNGGAVEVLVITSTPRETRDAPSDVAPPARPSPGPAGRRRDMSSPRAPRKL